MPKGPLGAPRPFAEYRLVIDINEPSIALKKIGPLGGPRPFAKNNPPVDQARIDECVVSEAGRNFGAGVVTRGATNDFSELNRAQKARAMDLAEKWCEGSLEATAMEDLTEEEAQALRDQVEQAIREGSTPSMVEQEMVGGQ